ncbi:MFS transporter [Nocardioides sp. CBS4Y-1]|uniref:MFS transporter n=2 Tax=Nocardioides acrostichi TaxID=2784339 RepID=A0A930V3U3_9ACTN|nr:MFS transporter [Nocardioides acrostichi]
MLGTALVAIDSTILATAVPSIVADVGGFTQFPWLFSVYLLAQAVTTPVYAKLADQYGRKPLMLVGIGLFVLGSVLCGLAWGMVPLIVFRAVQGLGAGAVQPMGMTIVGDLYTVAERAKVQGYLASVWATSSVLGPTLGGVFSDYLTWRAIFWVNVPLGAVAAWFLLRGFTETVEHRERRVDYAGAGLLASGGILLLLGLLEGGVRWHWTSPTSLTIFAASALLLMAFGCVESRAAEPILPFWVFRSRVLGSAMLASLAAGVLMLGLSSYVPLYAQSVLGHGALVAGLALAALTLGWPIAASNAGRLYLGVGFRATMAIGSSVALVGTLLLLTIGPDSSIWHVAAPCFVMGLGFGLVVSPSVIAAQSSVDWSRRGVATGTTMFARSVGSAVGVAVFGAVANAVVTSRLAATGGTPALEDLTPGVLDPAIHAVFAVSAGVAVLLLVAAAAMREP